MKTKHLNILDDFDNNSHDKNNVCFKSRWGYC